jgi:low affinity Fe/Cu permease
MSRKAGFFERMAQAATRWAGSTLALVIAFGIVLAWAITGPIFGFSPTWQLVINTGTTIVTFLMVFLIQRAQNKESLAVQLKLNELVAAHKGASNRLINVEDLTEQEIEILHAHYQRLVELAREKSLTSSHSIEEAVGRHRRKHSTRKRSAANGKKRNGPPAD